MKTTSTIRLRYALAICFGIIILAGCRGATPPISFFTLSSIRESQTETSRPSVIQDAVIAIGPVQFPDYLDRPQIVTRSGPNQLDISEFNRWGGKLDKDFLNVLAENLSILLSTDHVVIFPWKSRINPDIRIVLDIQRFEGTMGDSVLLHVTWTIHGNKKSSKPWRMKRSIIHQPVTGPGYDALVSAYSRAVAELSREMSGTIQKIYKNRVGRMRP